MTLRFTVLLLPAYCLFSGFCFQNHLRLTLCLRLDIFLCLIGIFQLCNDQHFVQMSEINNRCNAS